MTHTTFRIIMTPVGSSGDVLPFVGIGRLLRERGHDVSVIAAGPFREWVETAGLRFIEHYTVEEFERLVLDPDLWNQARGLSFILRMVGESMRGFYERIEADYEPGRTILVGHPLAFGTRVFEEKHHVPAVTLNLAPSNIRTSNEMPAYLPGKDFSWLPWGLKRIFWWLVDRMMIDRHIEPQLNAWRKELGLPPVHRIFHGWINSPQRSIGLFPDWFGALQTDWPASLCLTGFPLFDGEEKPLMDPGLGTFLSAGDPPIVFTPGSANHQASNFFEVSVKVATTMKRRALLLTRYPDQIPTPLPDTIQHRAYVPLSLVLPHSAAIVHHGGVGTCAQGLAAGVPHLVMPITFDQPDNATRLHRLGVGAWVEPKRFTAENVTEALSSLLESGDVAAACRQFASKINSAEVNSQTCDLIEQAVSA